MKNKPIKIIDLFAGPGGLGEGFSSFTPDASESYPFRISLSVEMEHSAWRTLRLRSFLRQFIHDSKDIPKEYEQYLSGKITEDNLYNNHPKERDAANEEALQLQLGKEEDNETVYKAIEKKLNGDKDWLLIGGPPCQAYSLVGRARNKGIKNYVAEKDHRHTLYREYLKIIDQFSPAVFIMENVKGILSSKLNNELIFDKIIEDLKNPGQALDTDSKQTYQIYSLVNKEKDLDGIEPSFDPHEFIIKAEEYGIPQARHRVILIGVRKDITKKPSILEKKERVSIETILGDLPKLRSGLSKHSKNDTYTEWANVISDELNALINDNTYPEEKIKNKIRHTIKTIACNDLSRGVSKKTIAKRLYQNMPTHLKNWYGKQWPGGVCNHDTRGHMDSDLARYLFCSIFAEVNGDPKKLSRKSPKLNDFPETLLPNHKNVKSGKFVDRFKVQEKSLPATTITSHISKDGHYYIHYDPKQCRSLTVREAARIQTFPDNYFFEGTRTQQYVQVGNAVPPLLAKKIAEIIFSLIR